MTPGTKTVFGSRAVCCVHLGIDSQYDTKFVLLDENEELLDSFLRRISDPPMVAKKALIAMRE